MLAALEATHWNKAEAAKRLNWSRMTLYRKLDKYAIDDQAGEGAARHTRHTSGDPM
jgi:DNA-binding NtrC family response regulator